MYNKHFYSIPRVNKFSAWNRSWIVIGLKIVIYNYSKNVNLLQTEWKQHIFYIMLIRVHSSLKKNIMTYFKKPIFSFYLLRECVAWFSASIKPLNMLNKIRIWLQIRRDIRILNKLLSVQCWSLVAHHFCEATGIMWEKIWGIKSLTFLLTGIMNSAES